MPSIGGGEGVWVFSGITQYQCVSFQGGESILTKKFVKLPCFWKLRHLKMSIKPVKVTPTTSTCRKLYQKRATGQYSTMKFR